MTLAGNLDITLQSGFIPANGDIFEILTTTNAGLVNGVFSNTPGDIYTFGSGSFDVSYTTSSVVLSNFTVPEPASCSLLGVGLLSLLAKRKRS